MMSAGQNRQSLFLPEFIGASSSCSALPLSQIVHDLAFILFAADILLFSLLATNFFSVFLIHLPILNQLRQI